MYTLKYENNLIIIVLVIGALFAGYWLFMQSQKIFSVSKTSGAVPLVATFEGNTKDKYCSENIQDAGYVYIIDFGDGIRSDRLKECDISSITHTYLKAGTYTARLIRETWSMNMHTRTEEIGNLTINVRNP